MFECILDVNFCVLKKYFCLVFRKINMSSYRILEIFQDLIKVIYIVKILFRNQFKIFQYEKSYISIV